MQGHHVSIHFSSVADEVSTTPFFLGSNPARADDKVYRGRLLGLEIALASALLSLLDDEQRAAATLDGEQPGDIIMSPAREEGLGTPAGLSASDMTPAQRQALLQLVWAYVDRLDESVAARQRRRVLEDLEGIHFAWIGDPDPDAAHYYRVHGRRFVIEYATQENTPNHVHTVWRDLEDDFGADLLRRHYEDHHEDR